MFYMFSIKYNTKHTDNYDNCSVFICRKHLHYFEGEQMLILQLVQDIDFCTKINENEIVYIFVVYINNDKHTHLTDFKKIIDNYIKKVINNIKDNNTEQIVSKNIIEILSFKRDFNYFKTNHKFINHLERYIKFDIIKEYDFFDFIIDYFRCILPFEIINIIVDFLKIEINIKFNLYKMDYQKNTYLLRLPYLALKKTDFEIIKSYNK